MSSEEVLDGSACLQALQAGYVERWAWREEGAEGSLTSGGMVCSPREPEGEEPSTASQPHPEGLLGL